jgi:hypothetical protein
MASARAKRRKQTRVAESLPELIVRRWRADGRALALDWLASELPELARAEIVVALRELEQAGVGRFEQASGRKKARFTWTRVEPSARPPVPPKDRPAASATQFAAVSQRVKLMARARSAPRYATTAMAEHTQGAGARSDELEHTFHLRPGFIVRIRLPSDVSSQEITRLSKFLLSLPFGGGG